jgi:hypothetical protein
MAAPRMGCHPFYNQKVREMPDILKNDITELLDAIHDDCDKPLRMSNVDTLMCDVYIWQEVMIHAKKKYDNAMKDLATLVSSDDKMRSKGAGDHTVESGTNFAMVAKVSNPANRFDKDKFISAVARKFRVNLDKLVKLAESDDSKKEVSAALSKKIIEL